MLLLIKYAKKSQKREKTSQKFLEGLLIYFHIKWSFCSVSHTTLFQVNQIHLSFGVQGVQQFLRIATVKDFSGKKRGILGKGKL